MFSPFSLDVIPMQRLFLINFEKDPDELYQGFEPQWFDDPGYGRGLRVVAWRKDGYIDVYQQPDLSKDADFSLAAKGLGDLVVQQMTDSYFKISDQGVNVSFAFTDKTGRDVDVRIVEKSPRPTRPFTILAPVGSSSEKPTFFPYYLMNSFYFVRRSMTEVRISINGRLHRPDAFPVPLNGSRIYFMRYSNDTFLVNWCPAYKGPLKPISTAKLQGIEFDTDQVSSATKIISARNGRHSIMVSFTPPFPDVVGLNDKTCLTGEFVIKTNREAAGKITGTYIVNRQGDNVQVEMHPGGGWQSKPGTLFLKFLLGAVKMFREWPKTYRWTATITLRSGDNPYIESRWERIE